MIKKIVHEMFGILAEILCAVSY